MDEEKKAASAAATDEADMSTAASESGEDLLNNSANISWSRIQKNLDDLNEQDMDEDEDDPPLIHIDLNDSSGLLSNDLDLDDWETAQESSDAEDAAATSTDRTNRLIQQSTSIRRVASTRSSSSSSLTVRQSGTPPFELDESSSLHKDLGRLVLADELKLIIENDEKCAICLEDFRADQLVREINCKHQFHIGCIDTWLTTHLNCPVCRKRLSQSLANDDQDLVAEPSDFQVAEHVFGHIAQHLQNIIIQNTNNSEPGVITLSLDPQTTVQLHLAPIDWRQPNHFPVDNNLQPPLPAAPRRSKRRPSSRLSLVQKRLAQVQQRRVKAKRRQKRQQQVPKTAKISHIVTKSSQHFTNCARLNRFRFN